MSGPRAVANLNLLAESAEGLEAIVTTTATNNLYDVSMDVRVGPTGGSIDLKAPKARVQGGLYVGTLVGQTGSFNLGDIWATGRISAATGMVALEAGGVRVYAATGSDASTRGVSFRQNITGGDVQSAYAGSRSSLSESALYLKALGATGQDAALYFEAAGGRANARQSEGRLSFVATGYTGATAKSAQMTMTGRPDGKSVIYAEPAGGFFGIGEGGLLVGACGETTDVPAGEIWADGSVRVAGGRGSGREAAVTQFRNWTTDGLTGWRCYRGSLADMNVLYHDGSADFVPGDVRMDSLGKVFIRGGVAAGSSEVLEAWRVHGSGGDGDRSRVGEDRRCATQAPGSVRGDNGGDNAGAGACRPAVGWILPASWGRSSGRASRSRSCGRRTGRPSSWCLMARCSSGSSTFWRTGRRLCWTLATNG